MILSRLSRVLPSNSAAPATPPPGMRIYAVGDIHGREDLLSELAELIARDCANAPDEVITVTLGDYVDRGPHSAAVIERLASANFPTRLLTLRGNHEDMLLQFLAEPEALDHWRRNGGLETLHSYGVDVSRAMRGAGYEAVRDAFVEALPSTHRRFLEATELSATIGDYFFCHAGVRPGVALERQDIQVNEIRQHIEQRDSRSAEC